MNFIYFLGMKNSLQRWRSNNKRKNYVRWHVWEHQLLSYTCQRTPGCRRAKEGVLYPLKKLYIQSWGKMKNVRHVFRKQNYVIFHFNIIYKHIHNVDFHFSPSAKGMCFSFLHGYCGRSTLQHARLLLSVSDLRFVEFIVEAWATSSSSAYTEWSAGYTYVGSPSYWWVLRVLGYHYMWTRKW